MGRARTAIILIAILSLGLAGCASRWTLETEVSTFTSGPAIAPGASYRFERLPSQQADEAAQRRLEAMAAPALARAGLMLDPAAARYGAQIHARVDAQYAPWGDPWFYGGRWAYGPYPRYGWHDPWRHGGWPGAWPGAWGPVFAAPAQTWYQREVGIVLRALPSREVVYESRARSDGPYANTDRVLPAMFDAALQGFPTPPRGVRQLTVEIGAPRADAPSPVKP